MTGLSIGESPAVSVNDDIPTLKLPPCTDGMMLSKAVALPVTKITGLTTTPAQPPRPFATDTPVASVTPLLDPPKATRSIR
jgi:hypothetical protein